MTSSETEELPDADTVLPDRDGVPKLGRTLAAWQVEIGRMWRFSRSNGITEGFHRKMKLIQRRAFGFRNFENYRRRVRALCA